MALLTARPPFDDPIGLPPPRRPGAPPPKGPQPVFVPDAWVRYFTDINQKIDLGPARLAEVDLSGQSASIGATSFPIAVVSAGLYRLTFYARITTAASTSSSLIVTFGWTDQGVSMTFSATAITGNTTASHGSETQLIYSDSVGPITYATTYASVGVTAMEYKMKAVAESVSA